MMFARRLRARAGAGAWLVALASVPAAAQSDNPAAANHPGTLVVGAGAQMGLVLSSAAQRRAAFSAADAIVALLKSDPALAKPAGYSVAIKPRAGTPELQPDSRPLGRIVYGATGALQYFSVADDGHTIGDEGGIVDFSIIVNAPGRLTDAEALNTQPDGGPSVLTNIRQTGEFRGHPVYNGECLVVSGRQEPPFTPLTRERYYQLLILRYRADSVRNAERRHSDDAAEGRRATAANAPAARAKADADIQATYEQLRKVDPKSAEQYLTAAKAAQAQVAHEASVAAGAAYTSAYGRIVGKAASGEGQHLAQLQATLDGLSAAERRAPVAVIAHHGDWDYRDDELADVDNPDSSPLVDLNPAFFDKSKPATAAQIVTVCMPGLQGLEDKTYEMYAGEERLADQRMRQRRTRDAVAVRDHLDWVALEALVKQ